MAVKMINGVTALEVELVKLNKYPYGYDFFDVSLRLSGAIINYSRTAEMLTFNETVYLYERILILLEGKLQDSEEIWFLEQDIEIMLVPSSFTLKELETLGMSNAFDSHGELIINLTNDGAYFNGGQFRMTLTREQLSELAQYLGTIIIDTQLELPA